MSGSVGAPEERSSGATRRRARAEVWRPPSVAPGAGTGTRVNDPSSPAARMRTGLTVLLPRVGPCPTLRVGVTESLAGAS
jgi:hypothetical protein